jgi:hypothetical protein
MRRFQQEVQAVAALNHPNILAIHDFGEHEGSPYIVMEFLDGETVRVRLGAGALPMRKASEYAEQIARGLAAAHVKGIVHRDLKPDSERTDGAADNHHQLDVWPAELKQMKWKWVRSRRRPQLVRALLPVTTQAIQNYISLPIELLLHTAGSFASNGGIRREFAFRSDHGLVGSDPLISGLPTIRELSQECLDRAEQLTASQGQISHSI